MHPETAPAGARLIEGEFIVEGIELGGEEHPEDGSVSASSVPATCKYDASILLADCKHPECGYTKQQRYDAERAMSDPDLITPDDEVAKHQELVTALATMRVTDVVVYHLRAGAQGGKAGGKVAA